jgi:uncharacterized protein YciW
VRAPALQRQIDQNGIASHASLPFVSTEPATLTRAHIHALRHAGLDDGEILEVNQAVAYFAYANRTVLGLGVTTDGEVAAASPIGRDGPDGGRHR